MFRLCAFEFGVKGVNWPAVEKTGEKLIRRLGQAILDINEASYMRHMNILSIMVHSI